MAKAKQEPRAGGNIRCGNLEWRQKARKWRVNVWVVLLNGKRSRCRDCTGQSDKKLAELREKEVIDDFIKRNGVRKNAKPQPANDGSMLFAQWVPIFRKVWEVKKGDKPLAKSTLALHTSILQHLLAFFGNMRLDAIGTDECRLFYKKQLTKQRLDSSGRLCAVTRLGADGEPTLNVSENYVRLQCQFAAVIMGAAVASRKISVNPWPDSRLELNIGPRVAGRALTDEEQAKLAAPKPAQPGAQDGLPLTPEQRAEFVRFLVIMKATGYRSGAMLKLPLDYVTLPWDEVVVGGRPVRFPVVKVFNKGKWVSRGLTTDAQEAYAEQSRYTLTDPKRRLCHKFLFPFSYTTMTKRKDKLAATAGVDRFIGHDVRRTLATELDDANIPVSETGEVLGHVADKRGGHKVTEGYIKNDREAKLVRARFLTVLAATA